MKDKEITLRPGDMVRYIPSRAVAVLLSCDDHEVSDQRVWTYSLMSPRSGGVEHLISIQKNREIEFINSIKANRFDYWSIGE